MTWASMGGVLIALALGCIEEFPAPVYGEFTSTASADAGPDVVATIGETVTFVAEGQGTFTWTFSDGVILFGPQIERAFDLPGHLTVVLEASTDGQVAADSAAVTVVYPPASEALRASSSIAGDADRVYVAMPDFAKVAVIDRATRAVAFWDTCGTPRSVAALAGGAWVACEADAAWLHDPDGDPVVRADLPYGSRPFGVVATSVGGALVTLQGAGAVASIFGDNAVVLPVEPDLRGLATLGDAILVSRWRSPDDGGVVLRIEEEDVQRWTLPLAPGPDSDTASRGVPSLLARIAVRPDGRVAVVPGIRSNVERGLVRDGLPMTFETTDRADLRQIDLASGEQTGSAAFDDRDLAVAAAYSPLGDWLFVLHAGMETVDVLDAFTLRKAGAVEDVGHGPDGLWVDGTELWVSATLSREVAVYDVTEVAAPLPVARIALVPPEGEVQDATVLHGRILFGRSADPRMSRNGYLSCASCHPEGDHDGRTWDFTDRGEGLRNTIALVGRQGASPIHWSANFDEVQDFENDIRGPMQGEGFLDDADWDATSATLGPPKAGLSDDLDALAAYVGSLDAFPRSPFPFDADAAAGEVLFLDPAVGCATCHPPPSYTDSAFVTPGEPLLHDVGTIGPDSGLRLGGPLLGIDTPTLRGGWATAPYLHDGSAATLREVLVDRNAGDLHGGVSGLTEDQIGQIVAFLEALE